MAAGKRSKRRSGLTLAEADAELKAAGEYERLKKLEMEQDLELAALDAGWQQAEKPLVDELRGAGFDVESAWDLVNTSVPYPDALPILLDHLERDYPDRVREGIARALAVGPDAMFGWDKIISCYRNEPEGTDTKDGLAAAIAAVASSAVIDEVIELVEDDLHGESRILLLIELKRSGDARAWATLVGLRDHPQLGAEAMALVTGGS